MKKVLIVDDDEWYLNFISQKIEEMGYNTIKRDNIDSTIKQIKKGLDYNLLIQDYSMYAEGIKGKGGELLAIVSKKYNPNAKIIMNSGWKPPIGLIDQVDCIHSKANLDSIIDTACRYLKE